MGTSIAFKGIGKGKPSVPSWSGDEVNHGTPDVLDQPTQQNLPPQQPREPQPEDPRNAIIDLGNTKRLFTGYIRNQRDQSRLKKSLASYVRNGIGGAQNATKRMKVSSIAANRLFSVVNQFVNVGVTQGLINLGIRDIEEAGIQKAFATLTDFICTSSSGIDEAITRRAYLLTLERLPDLGITDDGTFTREAAIILLKSFLVDTIFIRLMIDLGEKAHQRAESDRERLIIEQDVRAYIDTEIGDVIYNDLQELNQENLMQNIDDIYMDAYNILAEGDEE